MNLSGFCLLQLVIWHALVIGGHFTAWSAEPKVQILSPKDGAALTQEQKSVLISGKVASDVGRSKNVDLRFGTTYLVARADPGPQTEGGAGAWSPSPQ
jgi:hypothetical protein